MEKEHHQVEKALKESEELYRTIVETSSDAIIMIGLDACLIMVNQRASEMYGYHDKHELLGTNFFPLIAEFDRERALREFNRILKNERVRKVTYSLLRKDRTIFLGELSASLLLTSEGKPRALVIIIRDITHRKQIEEALAAEKERLAVTLRSISDAVITVNVAGRIVLMNTIAEKLTGWYQDEARGSPYESIINIVNESSRDPYACPIDRVLESGRVVNIIDNGIIIAKNKKERMITGSCAPIHDREGKIIGVVIIIRDNTEKQKLESELFKSSKLESIGVLAGGIAHDFNNILTTITSHMYMAKSFLDSGSEAYESIIEAEKAALKANKITNMILTFAKGGAPVKKKQSIKEIIEEAVEFSLRGSQVDCTIDLPNDLWSLEIDRRQIDQVISNLIINAEQAMPKGGTITVKGENIHINKEVTEDTNAYLPLEPGKYVRISIKDTGSGIPPEHLTKIYDPYFTSKPNGNGLGLTICYSILKKHNGLIFAKSQLDMGTSMHIYLPSAIIEVQVKAPKEEKISHKSAKILIMDDEEMVRKAAGRILTVIGYRVEFAKNGQEAITLYQQAQQSDDPIDVLIMDLTVPEGMGGKEAISHLLKIDPHVKAIVSSGYSHDPVMANYRDYGFKNVIMKPYVVQELNRIIDQVIRSDD